MTVSDLAAEIYTRVITDRILGNPKVWLVPEKQARGIAVAACEAAAIFVAVAWPQETPAAKAQGSFKPPVTDPLGPPLDE